MSSPVLDEALACVARAWFVHPVHGAIDGICTCRQAGGCQKPGKHPEGARWQVPVKRTEKQLRELFGPDSTRNLGILTGADSGIGVIDIDPQNGDDASFNECEERYGRLPETPKVLTGGGGEHLYFRHPGGTLKSSQGALGPGIDVRADGGQVVAPGSVHSSGRDYIWHPAKHPDVMPLAELPAAWLAALRPAKGSRADANRSVEGRAPVAPLLDVLDGVPEGRRHTSIFRLCCSLRGDGVPPKWIETLALHAAKNCRPPFPESEALAVVHDVVGRYAPNSGRQQPPTQLRLDIMSAVAATAGPARAADVARLLGIKYSQVKVLMWRMARAYRELEEVS